MSGKNSIVSFFSGFYGIFIHKYFYYVAAVVTVLFILGFINSLFLDIGSFLGILLLIYTAVQILILVACQNNFSVKRNVLEILSLGETHTVQVEVHNKTTLPLNVFITEELPYQLSKSLSLKSSKIKPNSSYKYSYNIKPRVRGIHKFGDFHLFIKLFFPVVERKIAVLKKDVVDVYPSIIQMKKFELFASKRISDGEGLKRIRKLGHGSEFEQIKSYVPGDDPRIINWKASARAGVIMTNHYQEERSQPIYQILDSSRAMKMPFNELTLLDHSINSALALSNIILKKSDKAGLVGFDKTVHTIMDANNSHYQLKKFLKTLYSLSISDFEANYEMLFLAIRRYVTKRSFLMLYTNFESMYALQRVLPQLKALSKRHLLLLVLFENTELVELSSMPCNSLYDIYDQTMAKKLLIEKEQIHNELDKHGIMNISVTTETVTADVINKYLEVKSRGVI